MPAQITGTGPHGVDVSQQHTVTSRNGTGAYLKQNQIVSRWCQVQAYFSTRRVKAVGPIYALYIASHCAHLHEMQATCCCQSQLTLLCPCCAGPAARCYDCSKLRKQSSGKGLLGCNRLLWQRSPAGRSHTEHSGVLSVVHVFERVRDWAQQPTFTAVLVRPELQGSSTAVHHRGLQQPGQLRHKVQAIWLTLARSRSG